MHFELGRYLRFFNGLAGFWLTLQRQIRSKWFLRNNDGGGMNTGRTLQTFKAFGDIDDLAHIFFGLVDVAQFLCGLITVFVFRIKLETVFEWCVSTHDERWHGLG